MWKPTFEEKAKLCQLSEKCSVAVDLLPYTDEFELLSEKLAKDVSRNEVFRVLGNVRKRKELPKKPK